VKESLINDGITEKIFSREDGKLVDEVNLTITYKGEVTSKNLITSLVELQLFRNVDLIGWDITMDAQYYLPIYHI
jgi:hypothetical protein